MPRPIAEILRDEYVAQGYAELRIQEHLYSEVDKLIVKLHRDLARMVRKMDPAVGASAAKMKYLEHRSRRLVTKTYTAINRLMDKELRDFAAMESLHVRTSLQKALTLALEDEL